MESDIPRVSSRAHEVPATRSGVSAACSDQRLRRRSRGVWAVCRTTRLTIIALVVLYCAGVWTGLALSVRSWSASIIDTVNRDANLVDRRSQPLEVGGDNDGVFDCEDYALLKRRMLIARGVSSADLQLWAVTTSRGSRHMVLEARGLILDSLTPWALPINQATYYRDWTPRGWPTLLPYLAASGRRPQ